jgi:glycosyltransferase involved in cell wall biosynthesis
MFLIDPPSRGARILGPAITNVAACEAEMRVLIVTREYPPSAEGGISRRLSNLVPALLDRGVEVGVVCFGGASLAGETLYCLDARSRILYTRSGEPSAIEGASVVADIWRLDRYASDILSRRKYDLVQIEEPVFGPFITSSVPRVVTTHSTQLGMFRALLGVFGSPREMNRLAFSGTLGWFFDRLCLNDAEMVVAVGSALRDEIRRLYRVPWSRIAVVSNGVGALGVIDKEEAKRKIGRDNFLCVYAGRIVDIKRIGDFVKALWRLKQSGFEDFSALILGSGPAKPKLVRMACKLDLMSNLRFIEYVGGSQFFDFLEAADVFVLPSCYEGFPISVLEAMAYGCVPVVADIPPLREIVSGGRNGMAFPVGDVQALSDALLLMARDEPLRTSMSNSARNEVSKRTWSSVADEYVRIYGVLSARTREAV